MSNIYPGFQEKCYHHIDNIPVTYCGGDFFLYHLPHVFGCPMRYCSHNCAADQYGLECKGKSQI